MEPQNLSSVVECDIVLLVWNLPNYTAACIDSVFKHTHRSFRLLIIDNGSDKETAQYLDSVKEKHPGQVLLIRNAQNLGFVKAANQGIKASSAPYLCLLNNDVIVTPGWLMQMIKIAESREDIGIVNPNSNTLGWKPKMGQTLEAVAQELKTYSGEYSELAWASGFCMLIKHQLIQKIGFFDEVYGMGMFEDADFCKRAQRLGYLCVCAKAAYVYHRERRSFMKFKQFDQEFEHNRQTFNNKWGKQKRILYVLSKERREYIEEIGEQALHLARQGDIIWIFLKDRNGQKIKRHSNIYVYILPKFFFNIVVLWRILKRKKKFDKIYVDDQHYGEKLNNLKLFHKAEVNYVH